MIVFSVIMSVQDFKKMSVTGWIFYLSWAVALLNHVIFNRQDIFLYGLSTIIFAAVYFVVKILSKNKFGTGDVYFGIFQGITGILPKNIWICVSLETILALIFILIKKDRKIPFIPFMALGMIITYFIGFIL